MVIIYYILLFVIFSLLIFLKKLNNKQSNEDTTKEINNLTINCNNRQSYLEDILVPTSCGINKETIKNITASSEYPAPASMNNMFNPNNLNNDQDDVWRSNSLYDNKGDYIGNVETNKYKGEYITLELESEKKIKCIKLKPMNQLTSYYNNNYSSVLYSPRNFRIFGSNDNITWDFIKDFIDFDFPTPASRYFNITPNKAYKYYRIAFNKVGICDSANKYVLLSSISLY